MIYIVGILATILLDFAGLAIINCDKINQLSKYINLIEQMYPDKEQRLEVMELMQIQTPRQYYLSLLISWQNILAVIALCTITVIAIYFIKKAISRNKQA